MPDKRTHRGPNPADKKLFAPAAVADLRLAVADYSLLLTKGYAENSSLKLVGDKFSLTQRQRLAVLRCACSDQQLARRLEHQLPVEEISRQTLAIDGYNLLITIEAAISGAVIFKARDGSFKDLAGIHGSYRKVTETIPALTLVGQFLSELKSPAAIWLLDSPVSNSGRLKQIIDALALKNNWPWQVKLLTSPDAELIKTDSLVVSTDGVVLDKCQRWTNLAREIIERKLPDTWLLDLASS